MFLMSEVPLYAQRSACYGQGSDLGPWAHNLFWRMWASEVSSQNVTLLVGFVNCRGRAGVRSGT